MKKMSKRRKRLVVFVMLFKKGSVIEVLLASSLIRSR